MLLVGRGRLRVARIVIFGKLEALLGGGADR